MHTRIRFDKFGLFITAARFCYNIQSNLDLRGFVSMPSLGFPPFYKFLLPLPTSCFHIFFFTIFWPLRREIQASFCALQCAWFWLVTELKVTVRQRNWINWNRWVKINQMVVFTAGVPSPLSTIPPLFLSLFFHDPYPPPPPHLPFPD